MDLRTSLPRSSNDSVRIALTFCFVQSVSTSQKTKRNVKCSLNLARALARQPTSASPKNLGRLAASWPSPGSTSCRKAAEPHQLRCGEVSREIHNVDWHDFPHTSKRIWVRMFRPPKSPQGSIHVIVNTARIAKTWVSLQLRLALGAPTKSATRTADFPFRNPIEPWRKWL